MCYIDAFESYLRLERHYSEHTIIAYLNDVRCFFNFCKIEDEKVGLVTVKEVREWLAVEMQGEGGKRKLKATSGKRRLSSLRSFFCYLKKKGLLKRIL